MRTSQTQTPPFLRGSSWRGERFGAGSGTMVVRVSGVVIPEKDAPAWRSLN
jgi:hypothetical protein